jgi:hypothetical protein
MITYKKWIALVLILAFIVLSLITAINYTIDPYGVYRSTRQVYSANKHVDSDPYLFKAFKVKKYQPEAIVLGTSRAMRLDPKLIESLTGDTTFNIGLSAATPYIMFNYLEYAIKVDKNLKSVFLGLDYEVFEASYLTHASFNKERLQSFFYIQDIFSTLLSKKAIKDSISVVSENLSNNKVMTENRYLSDGSFDEAFVYHPDNNISTLNVMPTKYQISNDSFHYIKMIRDLCEQNNLDLYVYISPVHAILLESFWQIDEWSSYEEWKKQLLDIIPVWDFSGYHEISMSSLKSGEYYNDLSHFSKKTGGYILHQMLSIDTDQVPDYFGVYVTSDHVNEHLESLRLNREQWPDRGKELSVILERY